MLIVTFLIVVVGMLVLNLGGRYHRQIVEQCKTLQLGMTAEEIISGLGHIPIIKVRFRQGNMDIETLFPQEPMWTIPSLNSQGIYIDIDLSTKRAIEIVCDEDFSLVDPVVKEMNKKGIYKERVKDL